MSIEFLFTMDAPGGNFDGTTILTQARITSATKLGPNRYHVVLNSAVGIIYPNELNNLVANDPSITDWVFERGWFFDDAGPIASGSFGVVTSQVPATGTPLRVADAPAPLAVSAANTFAFGGVGRVNNVATAPQGGGAVLVPTGYGLRLLTVGAAANITCSMSLTPVRASDLSVLSECMPIASGLTYQTAVP